MNFPANPATGDIFPETPALGMPQWQWDGEKWAPRIVKGAAIPEPPSPGVYGRRNESWNAVLPMTGGTMTGNLSVTGTITSNGSISAGGTGLRTPAGGPNAFAFHWNGNLYCNVDGATGWMNIPLDGRIWEIARYVISAEVGNNTMNSARLIHAGDFPATLGPGAAIYEINNAVICGYVGGNSRRRYIQYHVPNQGWLHAWFA